LILGKLDLLFLSHLSSPLFIGLFLSGSSVESGKESVLDVLSVKVIRPSLSVEWVRNGRSAQWMITIQLWSEDVPLLLGQQIRLIDQQQALPDAPLLLVSHTDPDFGNVFLQILASESDRVTAIDDLDDQVRSLNDSPKLTPYL
jgi:hypothetical protein